MAERKTDNAFYLQRISGSSRNGPGEELHGNTWEDPYSKTATGQKTQMKGRDRI